MNSFTMKEGVVHSPFQYRGHQKSGMNWRWFQLGETGEVRRFRGCSAIHLWFNSQIVVFARCEVISWEMHFLLSIQEMYYCDYVTYYEMLISVVQCTSVNEEKFCLSNIMDSLGSISLALIVLRSKVWRRMQKHFILFLYLAIQRCVQLEQSRQRCSRCSWTLTLYRVQCSVASHMAVVPAGDNGSLIITELKGVVASGIRRMPLIRNNCDNDDNLKRQQTVVL